MARKRFGVAPFFCLERRRRGVCLLGGGENTEQSKNRNDKCTFLFALSLRSITVCLALSFSTTCYSNGERAIQERGQLRGVEGSRKGGVWDRGKTKNKTGKNGSRRRKKRKRKRTTKIKKKEKGRWRCGAESTCTCLR